MRPLVRVAKQRSDLWGRLPLVKRSASQQAGRKPGTNSLSVAERELATLLEEAVAKLEPPTWEQVLQPEQRRDYERDILDTFAQSADVLTEALLAQFVTSGDFAARELGRKIATDFQQVGKADEPLPSQAALNFRFDRLDPRALEWASARAGVLITNMTAAERETFRQIVARAVGTGISPTGIQSELVSALRQINPGTEVGRQLTDLFGANMNGLTARYEQAVANRAYQTAADMADRGVQASKIVERVKTDATKYANRLRRARGRTIARTEILTANNAGRMAAYEQATEAGLMDANTATKQWEVGPFDVCPICVELGRSTSSVGIPLSQQFEASNGWSGNAPPAHPNCRCTVEVNPNTNIYSPTPLLGTGEQGDPFRFGDVRFTDSGR